MCKDTKSVNSKKDVRSLISVLLKFKCCNFVNDDTLSSLIGIPDKCKSVKFVNWYTGVRSLMLLFAKDKNVNSKMYLKAQCR